MERVRIGFVGVGAMGQVAHLANYVRLPDEVEVAAIAEPRTDLARRVAQRYGVRGVYPDAESMMAAQEIDAIVAPQPFTRHLQVVAPLYRFGLPVLTEKPLAMSSAVGAEILRMLEASSAPFHMVAYHKRSDPAIERLRALMRELSRSGQWGTVRYARMTMAGGDWSLGALGDAITSDEAYAAEPDTAVDAAYLEFVNFSVHQLNLIRYVLGEPYHVVYVDPTDRLLVGRSESGIPVTLERDPWGEPGWDESLVVGYDGGSLRVTLPAPLATWRAGTLEVRGDLGAGHQTALVPLPPVHAMLAQARNFAAAVRGDRPPTSTATDAYLDLALADEYFAARGA